MTFKEGNYLNCKWLRILSFQEFWMWHWLTSEDAGSSHVFCCMLCLELFLHAMKKTVLKTAGNINFHLQTGHSWPVWIPVICRDKTSCQYVLWSNKTFSKPCESAQESLESDNVQMIIFLNLKMMVTIHREVNSCLENVCPALFPFPNTFRRQQARYWWNFQGQHQ